MYVVRINMNLSNSACLAAAFMASTALAPHKTRLPVGSHNSPSEFRVLCIPPSYTDAAFTLAFAVPTPYHIIAALLPDSVLLAYCGIWSL